MQQSPKKSTQQTSIKLRFENIRDEASSPAQSFLPTDGALVDALAEGLSRGGEGLRDEQLRDGLGFLRRIKKLIETSQGGDNSKIRFRMVKSAKKQSLPHQETHLPALAPTHTGVLENKSELLSNKENRPYFSVLSKAKLKKVGEVKAEVQIGEVRSLSTEQILLKMRSELVRITEGWKQRGLEIERLTEKVRDLEYLVAEKESKFFLPTQPEPIKIDFKFSLKCLDPDPTLIPSSSAANHCLNDNALKELQMVVISQGIEIERLVAKLVDKERWGKENGGSGTKY